MIALLYNKAHNALNMLDGVMKKLAPLADLLARLYIAQTFFLSGMNKFQDWETTLYLFKEEYHVPLLSPEMAAVAGTGSEIIFAVMLAAGLFTRFSALCLFMLNIIAVMSYYSVLVNSHAAIHDHLEWGIILALLMVTHVRQWGIGTLLCRSGCHV